MLNRKSVGEVRDVARSIRENVQKIIVGKDDAINLALVALLCKGHALLKMSPARARRRWPRHSLSHSDVNLTVSSAHLT